MEGPGSARGTIEERRRIDKSGVWVMTHLARAAKQNAGAEQTRDVSLHLRCVLSFDPSIATTVRQTRFHNDQLELLGRFVTVIYS